MSMFFTDTDYDAVLIIDTTDRNMDMYYLSGLFVPDQFALIVTRDSSTIIIGDLEYERARRDAKVDSVVRIIRPKENLKKIPVLFLSVIKFLKDNSIKKILVHDSFSISCADILREEGFVLNYKSGAFIPERTVKTPEEIGFIAQAVSDTESVLDEAIQMIADSDIHNDILYYDNRILTSEKIKDFLASELMSKGYLARHTIVAGARQSYNPHEQGSGSLSAHKPIVIDLFPQSLTNFYYCDMTRTVLRGIPDKYLLKMYDAVRFAQEVGVGKVCEGVSVGEVHNAVCAVFEDRGFKTGVIDGYVQGFIHSTGHGVGLDIHEKPSLYAGEETLKAGNIVTVEPGLYYTEYGGIRIEDIVVVEKDGARNLNFLEKKFVVGN